jgi:hypothetical protein
MEPLGVGSFAIIAAVTTGSHDTPGTLVVSLLTAIVGTTTAIELTTTATLATTLIKSTTLGSKDVEAQ